MENKEMVYIFGDNEDNRKIYDSIGSREGIILAEPSEEQIAGLVKCANEKKLVVVNMQNEAENLRVCKTFVGQIAPLSEEEKEELFQNLRIVVFAEENVQSAYEEVLQKGYAGFVFADKYQQMAMDFVERYPFAKFMDARHIDYKTSLLKNGVDINVFMLGFGKLGEKIYFSSVANNQFLAQTEKGIAAKLVNYYIFDKEQKQFPCYRYAQEMHSYSPADYLPLPSILANEQFFQMDAKDDIVFDKIKLLSGKEGAINFVVIACGSDEENIAIAQKVMEKRQEWQANNLIIFLVCKGVKKEESPLAQEDCFFIGNEKECVYSLDKILGGRFFHMAQLRNAVYNLEYDITNGKMDVTEEYIRRNSENSMKNWFCGKPQLERDSSTYACLSLRSKLNLMGLDYCGIEENNIPALTPEEYLAVYAKGDIPDFERYNLTADGKPIIYYTIDFPDSRRKTMAIHEHLRWNAFMLSKGMTPASKEQILGDQTERKGRLCYTNGKNYVEHRHGNLTTFEGLVAFRRMIAERDGVEEAEKDVIKYDYQLLDDAYWFLEKAGCKIIYKK